MKAFIVYNQTMLALYIFCKKAFVMYSSFLFLLQNAFPLKRLSIRTFNTFYFSLCFSLSFSVSPPSLCPSFLSFSLASFHFYFLSLFFFFPSPWDPIFFSSSIQVFFILFSEQLWYFEGKERERGGRLVSVKAAAQNFLPHHMQCLLE